MKTTGCVLVMVACACVASACKSPASSGDVDSGASASASATTAKIEPSATVTASVSATASATASASASAVASASASPSAKSKSKGATKPPPDGFGQGGLGLSGVGEGGGCPCGCDHSKEMIADLRAEGDDAALASIEESLRTIGEREDGGYITDRMVQHRLRLIDFGKELGRTAPFRFTAIPAIHSSIGGAIGETRVRAELFAHGETTEIVHGKEKPLLASFVVRLDLDNRGAAAVTLRTPTLDGALPVSRWYVVGGDGTPWDGVLRAGEHALVHAIGYAAESFAPAALVATTVHFESLSLPMQTRARAHWSTP